MMKRKRKTIKELRWKTDKRIESMLRGFEGRLLRRMLGFTWEDKISNIRLKELTGLGDINKEVIKGRWRWTGLVHRMRRERRPRQVLKWTPQGQRSRGRPRETWKRLYETERKGENRTGLNIENMVQDRIEWRQFVSALCASGRDED